MKILQIGMLLGLAAIGFVAANELLLPGNGGIGATARPAQTAKAQPLPRKPRFVVAFRLDPEITQGFYMGDRWVSPPSFFFAQHGTRYVVEAKAQRIDSRAERKDFNANWAVSDPEMVAVSHHGRQVTITVRQPGESNLTVSAGGNSAVVHVRAQQIGDAMQVDFTQ